MNKNKLPSGVMRAINKRLELMGVTLQGYTKEFEQSSCDEQDLKLLNKIVESIPDSGRQSLTGLEFPVLRAEEDTPSDPRIPVECAVTSYDVTLPVVISVLAHPFFWNGGESTEEIVVDLSNEELYSLSGFMNAQHEQIKFRLDFQLIKNIFRDFQPYMDSKLASRIPEKELKEFMGPEYSNIPLDRLLATLSYLGFPLSRNSIIFPHIHYSVGISKNIPAKHTLKGMTEFSSGYTEDFQGGLGDPYFGEVLGNDMEDIYARRDREYFEGKDD